MRRALVLGFAIAALVACGDDDAGPDAAATDAAASDAARASDGAASADAGSACERGDYAPLSDGCGRCVCIACRPIAEACDETCKRFVDCLAHCDDTVERCAERCPNEEGLTLETERVSNLAICIGNLCPMECELPQSL